jgi:hypothetical protein
MTEVLLHELNQNVIACGFSVPKQWQRIDVGHIETYVGDETIVIGMVTIIPKTRKEMEDNNKKAEKIIIKYLQSEGFIGTEYVYVGLQTFNLKRLPNDLNI